jgi:hypothetical protein
MYMTRGNESIGKYFNILKFLAKYHTGISVGCKENHILLRKHYEINVKLKLCLNKDYTMETYGGLGLIYLLSLYFGTSLR